MTVVSLLKKVKAVDTDKVITEAMTAVLPDLIDENKKQLYEGFDKTGNKIQRKYRSNKYARVKNQMNPLPGLGTPDLKVSGRFYRGITVKLSGNTLVTQSTDEKGPELEAKYEDIYGLGGQFKKDFVSNDLRPSFNNEMSKAIGLKFG